MTRASDVSQALAALQARWGAAAPRRWGDSTPVVQGALAVAPLPVDDDDELEAEAEAERAPERAPAHAPAVTPNPFAPATRSGVPAVDVRGSITSHRARSTIASQLYNAKEPMTLFELQAWLGHRTPTTTQHYAKITPNTLSRAYNDAGYFARNVRTIEVLVDRDAVAGRPRSRVLVQRHDQAVKALRDAGRRRLEQFYGASLDRARAVRRTRDRMVVRPPLRAGHERVGPRLERQQAVLIAARGIRLH